MFGGLQVITTGVKMLAFLFAVTVVGQETASTFGEGAEAVSSDHSVLLQQQVQPHTIPVRAGQEATGKHGNLLEVEDDDAIAESGGALVDQKIFPGLPGFHDLLDKAKKEQEKKIKEALEKKKKAIEEQARKEALMKKREDFKKSSDYSPVAWMHKIQGTYVRKDLVCADWGGYPIKPVKVLTDATTLDECKTDMLMDEECGQVLYTTDVEAKWDSSSSCACLGPFETCENEVYLTKQNRMELPEGLKYTYKMIHLCVQDMLKDGSMTYCSETYPPDKGHPATFCDLKKGCVDCAPNCVSCSSFGCGECASGYELDDKGVCNKLHP